MIYDELISFFNMLLFLEIFRWVCRIFRSDRFSDLWPSLFTGFQLQYMLGFPPTGNQRWQNTIG